MSVFFELTSIIILGGLILIRAEKSCKYQPVFFSLAASVVFFIISIVVALGFSQTSSWIRYCSFYLGQLLFIIFLELTMARFYMKARVQADQTKPKGAKLSAAVPLSMSLSPTKFAIDEGLPHLLVMPLLFILFSRMSVYFSYVDKGPGRRFLRSSLAAMVIMCLSHITEFIIESQGLLDKQLGTHIETIEYIYNFVAFGLILFAVNSLSSTTQKKSKKSELQ